MVRGQLGITARLRPVDAADAVAVALCHLAMVPPIRRVAGTGAMERATSVASR